MNKKERNAAVRELDALQADIATVQKQTGKLIAASQKKRDNLTRPMYRRLRFLRHELAEAFQK